LLLTICNLLWCCAASCCVLLFCAVLCCADHPADGLIVLLLDEENGM
jgi:hypothetical protein